MTFGERLQELRELRGWSRTELARRAEVSHTLVTLIEQGKRPNPTLGVLRKLAAALGVTLDMLAGDSEGETEPAALVEVGA